MEKLAGGHRKKGKLKARELSTKLWEVGSKEKSVKSLPRRHIVFFCFFDKCLSTTVTARSSGETVREAPTGESIKFEYFFFDMNFQGLKGLTEDCSVGGHVVYLSPSRSLPRLMFYNKAIFFLSPPPPLWLVFMNFKTFGGKLA